MYSQRLRFALATTMVVAAVTAFGSPASAAGGDAANLRIVQDSSTVSIFDGDRPSFRYRYAGVPMKPYADQLFSPDGVQVLRDSPHDHKHHHGLMFALSVDGVDFWGEVGKGYGKQKQRAIGNVTIKSQDGVRRAGFVQKLDWVGPASDKSLLVERRAINELKAEGLGATLVEWRSRLQAPPGKESITLTGHQYFGLGLRFLESMDDGGRFFNSDDKPGEAVPSDRRLTPAKWCAYTAKADGRPVTVAIFDHPSNLRHPARMFTLAKHFAYLSATRNEWKEPIVVEAGRPLDLRYGVALWDGEADKATVERLYQRWLKLSIME